MLGPQAIIKSLIKNRNIVHFLSIVLIVWSVLNSQSVVWLVWWCVLPAISPTVSDISAPHREGAPAYPDTRGLTAVTWDLAQSVSNPGTGAITRPATSLPTPPSCHTTTTRPLRQKKKTQRLRQKAAECRVVSVWEEAGLAGPGTSGPETSAVNVADLCTVRL